MADDIDIEFGKTTDNEYKETAKHIVLNAHAISKSCTSTYPPFSTYLAYDPLDFN